MGTRYSNAAVKVREEISQTGNDFNDCEIFSQLQENLRKLIESCTLSKSTIAASLGVQPSIISAWLDRSGNGRAVSVENAKRVLYVARRQPVAILLGIDRLEKSIMEILKQQYGNQDPGVF